MIEVQANVDLSPERSCKLSPLKNGNGNWGVGFEQFLGYTSALHMERLSEFGALPATGPTRCKVVHTWGPRWNSDGVPIQHFRSRHMVDGIFIGQGVVTTGSLQMHWSRS